MYWTKLIKRTLNFRVFSTARQCRTLDQNSTAIEFAQLTN